MKAIYKRLVVAVCVLFVIASAALVVAFIPKGGLMTGIGFMPWVQSVDEPLAGALPINQLQDKPKSEAISVKTAIRKREVPIDFGLTLQANHELYKGDRRVLVPGSKGLAKQTVKVIYENDKRVAERVLTEEVVVHATNQVLEFGIKDKPVPARATISRFSESARMQQPLKEMLVESTAYTHTGNTTFTGIWPSEGIVAVDPKVIPLGTKMYVEGYGYAEAQDTGGLIKGEIIDVFMDSYEKAIQWGRKKNVRVYILEYPK